MLSMLHIISGILLIAGSVTADDSQTHCARVTEVEGIVEILSSDQKNRIPVENKALVPCGAWVSAQEGMVQLELSLTHSKVRVGQNSLLRLKSDRLEPLILFKGLVWAEAQRGHPGLTAYTANSKIVINESTAIVLYLDEQGKTQVVAIEGKTQFINRFALERAIVVSAGETSELDAPLERVIPTTPKAVAVASLKPILQSLSIIGNERSRALKSAHDRQENRFAGVTSQRKIASTKPADYSRAPASASMSEQAYLKKRWETETLEYTKNKKKLIEHLKKLGADDE